MTAVEPGISPALGQGIIDMHAHAMLSSWLAWASEHFNSPVPPFEGRIAPDWSAEEALAVMDRHGIEAMVLSNPIGTKDMDAATAIPLARRMNDELASLVSAHPKRFGAFAVLPLQDVDASVAEMRYALDALGMDGVCIQTSFEGHYPGDPKFEPIFAELDKRCATVFVHPHGPDYIRNINIPIRPGMMEFVFDTTRAVASLICSGTRHRYPNFRYIATHGGGTVPYIADRIAFVATRGLGFGTKFGYNDVIEALQTLHYDVALATRRGSLLALRDLALTDNLLLGFDYPFAEESTFEPAKRELSAVGVFDESELRRIARDNSLKVLPGLNSRIGDSQAKPRALSHASYSKQ